MATHVKDNAPPLDATVAAYGLARLFFGIVAVALLVKLLLVTTVAIRTDQMSPALRDGDRALVLKALACPGLSLLAPLRRGQAVVFRFPHSSSRRGCLRVAGLPGDTVAIGRGQYGARDIIPTADTAIADSVLPPEYSPRDYAAPFRLPHPGDTVCLDSLSQRDFVFYASMYAQQNPGHHARVRPQMFIDGVPSNEYIVGNFPLYKGVFDSIPGSLDFDWFFWDRLRDNLRLTLENRAVKIVFRLVDNGETVRSVCVEKPFVFLVADDWRGGYDSRYVGPICASRIVGSVPIVLWSMGWGESEPRGLRFDRLLMRVRRGPTAHVYDATNGGHGHG